VDLDRDHVAARVDLPHAAWSCAWGGWGPWSFKRRRNGHDRLFTRRRVPSRALKSRGFGFRRPFARPEPLRGWRRERRSLDVRFARDQNLRSRGCARRRSGSARTPGPCTR
jgi:hypothetical protein